MRKRRARPEARLGCERGFSLIELMVVVLIISILIAIATPNFLGARTRAQNRASQSELRNALIVAEIYYANTESFDATAADLEAIEPDMDFDDAVANASTAVIGVESNPGDIVMVRQSATGEFFCIGKDEDAPGTTYGSGAAVTDVDSLTECADPSW